MNPQTLKEYVVVQNITRDGLPMIWTKQNWEDHFNWSKEHNRAIQFEILATFSKDSPYQGSAGVWVKASEQLPKVGIYNALYNGDHVIFQVHDGGFRVINYHGEKNDSPKLFLIRYLDDSAATPAGDGLPPDLEEMIKREPVTFFLVNILKYLDMVQQVSLRDALIQRTPNDSACITTPPNKPV